jgi:hypothetical protein
MTENIRNEVSTISPGELRVITNFVRRCQECERADGDHFQHSYSHRPPVYRRCRVTGTVPAGSQRAFAVFSSPRLIYIADKQKHIMNEQYSTEHTVLFGLRMTNSKQNV